MNVAPVRAERALKYIGTIIVKYKKLNRLAVKRAL